MRQSLVLLSFAAVFLATAAVHAECNEAGLRAWPEPGTVVPPNVHFVVEGVGVTSDLVATLDKSHPAIITIKDGLRFLVTSITDGDEKIAQAVLVPEKPLRGAHEYLVRFHGTGPGEPKEYHPTVTQKGKQVRMQWRVGETPDTKAPTWTETPRVLSSKRDERGDGVETFVRIAVSAKDERGMLLYRVRIRERGKGKAWRSWFLRAPAGGQSLVVGRGKCSGPFELFPGRRYEIRLSAVDAAGNETNAPGNPLRFKGPFALH